MSVGNIFISYRRDDTSGHAGRLYDRLKERFPGRVVMDVSSIDLGDDFVEEIERQLGACLVFIELIGHEWATITDQTGKRRLDQPRDFVRLEVAIALRRAITIIPILVEGATMPDSSTLPEEIAPLTRHNALAVTESDFDYDVERLVHRLDTVFGRTGAPAPFSSPVPLARKSHPGRVALLIGIAAIGLFIVGAIGLFVLLVIFGDGENSNANATARAVNSVPINAQKVTPAPPANTVLCENSNSGLDDELTKHYIDFSFYYPKSWTQDPYARSSGDFVSMQRNRGDVMLEKFAVSWYSSNGTFEDDEARFPDLVSQVLPLNFSGFSKLSEGPTKVNSLDGYEARLEKSRATNGDLDIWGRVVFLPPGVKGQQQSGVMLLMLATSKAPELRSVDEVGKKGGLSVILDSFKFGVTR